MGLDSGPTENQESFAVTDLPSILKALINMEKVESQLAAMHQSVRKRGDDLSFQCRRNVKRVRHLKHWLCQAR